MKKCLIIGANGLIGRQVGKLLSNKGIQWEWTSFKRKDKHLHPLDIADKKMYQTS